MLRLSDVTLVMIETMEHDLARLAVRDCLAKVEFGDVLIFSDKPEAFNGHRVHEVPNWPSKLGWSQFSWYGVPEHLRTPFALFIQWDSWVLDPEMWRDDFFNYDYIGAPWPWHPNYTVGNGGFSLRSTKLCRYLADNRERMPCFTAADDDLLCRKYRPGLEDVGFKWGHGSVASRFAFECVKPSHGTFGYHAIFNWPKILDEEGLAERMPFVKASPYIKRVAGWREFAEQVPECLT